MCINITPASLYIIYLLYYNLRESEEGGQEEGESRRQRSAAEYLALLPPELRRYGFEQWPLSHMNMVQSSV